MSLRYLGPEGALDVDILNVQVAAMLYKPLQRFYGIENIIASPGTP